jgi:predicted small integral membrane protein
MFTFANEIDSFLFTRAWLLVLPVFIIVAFSAIIPLVALLCYAGLRAIPEAYYQAAKIDGASSWAVFRYIQLPKMRGVLTIAVMIGGMLVWELVSPTIARKGFLAIPTTRGTRLFVGLLGTAYIHLAWIGLTDWNLWFALPVSAVWVVVVMRWG